MITRRFNETASLSNFLQVLSFYDIFNIIAVCLMLTIPSSEMNQQSV